MNHASLFSGIGGFDLAAREVGWNNVFQCEIDPFCQSVLKYYFPKTVLYEDIKRTDMPRNYSRTRAWGCAANAGGWLPAQTDVMSWCPVNGTGSSRRRKLLKRN